MLWENPFSFTGFLMQISRFLALRPLSWVPAERGGKGCVLMGYSLHHAWSGILHGGHLPDSVKNVSAVHLRVEKPPLCI